MENNNYEDIFKNTIKQYPIYLLKILLKKLECDGLILNSKRKNKNINYSNIVDVSNFSKESNKIENLFLEMNGIIKKCEEFEYDRGYRYFYIFKIGNYNTNVINDLINKGRIKLFTDDLVSNDSMNTIITNPTYKANDKDCEYIFKFNLKLKSKLDDNSMKHTILAIIKPNLGTLEIRQDAIPILYQVQDNFYNSKVLQVKSWILVNLKCSIDNIDFESVVKYMKSNKKYDVNATAISIRRNGMKAILDSASNSNLTLPILDELRNKIDSDEIFNKDDETVKNIKKSLEDFIEEIEENSDLPAAKILWKKKGYKISSYHDQTEEQICSFRWAEELKNKEAMDYVTEYLIQCEKELRESLDN